MPVCDGAQVHAQIQPFVSPSNPVTQNLTGQATQRYLNK
jgi:hypothetical protein